jgi:hypothetical protein
MKAVCSLGGQPDSRVERSCVKQQTYRDYKALFDKVADVIGEHKVLTGLGSVIPTTNSGGRKTACHPCYKHAGNEVRCCVNHFTVMLDLE